ncbi:MAG: YbaB/EbfC family nucleoid-associated protein [Syntrophobacterales bacterium]|nr:YbaB/EbfC family nucleoid-associated protein [Syntrophobacterales bacterium]
MIKGLDLIGPIKAFQEKMERVQEELEQKTVEASSGGGMVTVVINGKLELVDITIDPQVVNPQDLDMLEDLIIAAVNDGLKRAQELMAREISKLAGGINIPGLNVPGLL